MLILREQHPDAGKQGDKGDHRLGEADAHEQDPQWHGDHGAEAYRRLQKHAEQDHQIKQYFPHACALSPGSPGSRIQYDYRENRARCQFD